MKGLQLASLLWLLILPSIKCQFYEYINFGLKTGVNLSEISNIPDIYNEADYSPAISLTTDPKFGAAFGVFLNYRLQNAPIGFQPELYYSMEHTELKRSINNEPNYTVLYKFNYIQFNTIIKYYPSEGLNIGIGPQIGFNVSPDNIDFKSIKYPESNLHIQQEIRNSSRGETNFQLMLSLGYEFRNGLFMDGRYSYGLADVLQTFPNSDFNWIENKNTGSSFQISLGYAWGISNY